MRFIMILLCLIVLFIAAPTLAQRGERDDSPDLPVINLRDIDVPPFGLRLSPNGGFLAYNERDAFCITLINLRLPVCTPYPEDIRLRGAIGTWSPDGTKIAMTEDFLRRFDEADIWVYEVSRRQFINYTDDGVNVARGLALETPQDFFPVWNATSDAIYFYRVDQPRLFGVQFDQRITIQKVSLADGAVQQVMQFPSYDYLRGIYGPLAVSPDETQIAVLIQARGNDDVDSGLYLVDIASGRFTQFGDNDMMYDWAFPEGGFEAIDITLAEIAWLDNEQLLYSIGASISGNVFFRALVIDTTSDAITPLFITDETSAERDALLALAIGDDTIYGLIYTLGERFGRILALPITDVTAEPQVVGHLTRTRTESSITHVASNGRAMFGAYIVDLHP